MRGAAWLWLLDTRRMGRGEKVRVAEKYANVQCGYQGWIKVRVCDIDDAWFQRLFLQDSDYDLAVHERLEGSEEFWFRQ